MKIEPLHDNIYVTRAKAEDVSKGGIILPEVTKDRPQMGEVLAVGPGRRRDDGAIDPVSVQPGDHVLFGKYSGNEIEIDGRCIH